MAPSTSGRRWAAREAVPPGCSFTPPHFEDPDPDGARVLALERDAQVAIHLLGKLGRSVDRDDLHIVVAQRGKKARRSRLLIIEKVVHRARWILEARQEVDL